MNFEDYAQHIFKKHKLSVAIAILKIKPKNISTIQYIEQLKSRYKNKMDEDDVKVISDDVSVCSDDFHFDENDFNNSETILRHFESDFDHNCMDVDEIVGNDGFVTEKELQENYHMPENLSQNNINTTNIAESNTFFDIKDTENKAGLKTTNSKSYNCDITAQNDYTESIKIRNESNSGVLTAQNNYTGLKLINTESYNAISTTQNDNASLELLNNKQNIGSTAAQNDDTGSKSFNDEYYHGINTAQIEYTGVNLLNNQQNSTVTQNYYSGSKPINDQYIDGTMAQNDYSRLKLSNQSYSDIFTNQNEYTSFKTVGDTAPNACTVSKLDNNITVAQDNIIINNAHEKLPNAVRNVTTDHETEIACKAYINNMNIEANTQSTQETVLCSHGNTQNCTHYSQSQINMSIPKNLLYGHEYNHTKQTTLTKDNNNITDSNNKNTNNNNKAQETAEILINSNRNSENNTHFANNNILTENGNEHTKNDNYKQFSQEISEYFNEMHDINEVNSNLNNTIIGISHNSETEFTEFDIINEIQTKPYNFEMITQNLSQSTETHPNQIENNNTNFIKDINTRNSNNNTENDNNQQSLIVNEDLDQEDESLQEVVSFKILEELNKIKKFLNRDRYSRGGSSDGYSTDTGYKSDSQIRSSNKSALQLSGTIINQSAHSLFNYLTQCHLSAATRDITYEIAQVFGQLIDRLHEEEKCPSFLEDLLETVDKMLENICTGDNTQDSEFLLKEEYIERIYLLNESIHLQKHTIEKISKILNNFHKKITEKNSTYEQTNPNETENITYIFHILEILLKKYMKNKENFSQSSQNSQEDQKNIKKSLITDIWKKKWNPDYKNEEFLNVKEKKCILKYCIDCLNKIIVDCLNEYSLVAYSALKCFNIIQS